jgi:hypothetical protein
MTVVDLIMELSKLPPEMEVIFQKAETEEGFTMEVVEAIEEIIVDGDIHYIMINPFVHKDDGEE